MVVGIGGIAAVGYVVSIAASAPSLSSLKERDPGSNSEVLAADGSRLGFIQASELRLPAESDEFPKVLKDATVAIEDRRFYQHEGIDYEGVIRAGVQNLVNQKTVQGGSTITMQLARNLYISSERTYQRKIREAKVARGDRERSTPSSGSSTSTSTRCPTAPWAGSRRSAPRPPRGSTSTSAWAS